MKNILLSVCGLNPQIITEAIYALHQEGKSIDEIHIITTREGKDYINALLLSSPDGQFYKYLKDYNFDQSQIAFDSSHVYVVTDQNGIEIDDIEDEDDNASFLDKCLELAFHLTNTTENAVFFLIAGGRKSMSACLTLAAQFYGRPQDRVYHVLVSSEFESNRNFFYPPPEPVDIELKDSKGEPYYKKTNYAQIKLIPMPFVSIRNKLPGKWLKMPQDPATLMFSTVRESKPLLTVNLNEKKLVYKKLELDLQPSLLSIYALFVMQKKDCSLQKKTCRNCTECFLNIQDIFAKQTKIIEIYHQIIMTDHLTTVRSDFRIGNIDAEAFNQYKAKIKKFIFQKFGPYILPKLEIRSYGKRPDTTYGIALDKKQIRIVF